MRDVDTFAREVNSLFRHNMDASEIPVCEYGSHIFHRERKVSLSKSEEES